MRAFGYMQSRAGTDRYASIPWAAASICCVNLGVFGAAQAASDDRSARNIKPLEEVVVTAQKRQEKLQDVPISISVLGGDELNKFTTEGVADALRRVPGVITTPATTVAGGTQLTVRGVAAGGPVFNGSSPIAYYLDSVPFGLVKTALVPDSSAYDLDRIEVLRGPQGTLYGATAQNGVVRLLTKDPELGAFEMSARTAISTTERGGENYRADMALNVPLIEDKLAVRAVAGYQNLSGWIDNAVREDVNDAELRNFRVKVSGQLTDAFSVGLNTWISRSDAGAPQTADDEGRRASPHDESSTTTYDVYGLKLGYEATSFSVTSMTTYVDYHSENTVDLLPYLRHFFNLNFSSVTESKLDSDVLAEEIIVNSSAQGAWRWSIGGMYRDAEDRLNQARKIPPPSPTSFPVDFTDTSKSVAVFGQLTRLFLDGRFELTGGLRYFEDDVTQIENRRSSSAGPSDLIRNNKQFDATTPRIVMSWHPVSDSTIYASYAEGFRSGFNQNANTIRLAPEFPTLKADTLSNYELGAKGLTAGGAFSYEIAVFYMDWQDVQQTLSIPFNGIPASAVANGESASGLGAEFAITASPLRGLALAASVSWNDLEADSDAVSVGTVSLYRKGERLNFSPEYTAGASADYSFGFAGGYQARFSLSGTYQSSQLARVFNLLTQPPIVDRSDSWLIGTASVSIDSPGGWTATAFVDNLGDEDGRGPGGFNVEEWSQRLRPRTVGLQLEYRF
jgi:iron complex outermembrane recepter protein